MTDAAADKAEKENRKLLLAIEQSNAKDFNEFHTSHLFRFFGSNIGINHAIDGATLFLRLLRARPDWLPDIFRLSAKTEYQLGKPMDISCSKTGESAVGLCAKNNRLAHLELLLANNFSIAKRETPSLATPFLLACGAGHCACAAALLDAGASLDEKDASFRGCLHYAAACPGGQDTLRMLLSRNARPNERDASGKTPLHAALESGQADSARILLLQGADPASLDVSGNTPFDCASPDFPSGPLRELQALPPAINTSGIWRENPQERLARELSAFQILSFCQQSFQEHFGRSLTAQEARNLAGAKYLAGQSEAFEVWKSISDKPLPDFGEIRETPDPSIFLEAALFAGMFAPVAAHFSAKTQKRPQAG